ncbi:MAG TPA: radical SAM protein [Syntrophales bacterium]|nr:radical SAM protein [Syntrophales bacterium]HOL59253.1 radical SAM protein [Syntrophales bacterium]HPO35303.1 radical SAM protein [Syntrophales bacterium]
MQIGRVERNEYPIGLIVDIHDFCNASCRMCPYESLKGKLKRGRMKWELYEKIVDDFSSLMDRFKFEGVLTYCNMGEPFIFDDLEVYTKYAEERGIWVYINTNASLMTPDKINRLIESGFKGAFNISFHAATPELYQEIMGIPMEGAKRNIAYLLDHYPKEHISFNVLNYHWPKGEEEKVRALFAEWGVEVEVNNPISRGGLLPLRRRYVRHLAGCAPERVLYQMVICHDGDVILCCNDMGRREVVGNLEKNSIYEVWNGEAFARYLEQIYLGKPSDPNMICHWCEESVLYWSWRRMAKSLVPNGVRKWIKKRKRRNDWGVAKHANL